MYYVLCFISGSVLTLFAMALLLINSDTITNQLIKAERKIKELEKELADKEARLKYYKALINKYNFLVKNQGI